MSTLPPEPPARFPGPSSSPRVLVVGAGAIGSVLAASLLSAGHRVTVLTTNPSIHRALSQRGFELTGKTPLARVPAPDVREALVAGDAPFDFVLLATQPPQVDEAAASAAPYLAPGGRMVCFQNGLCEERVARAVGRERVVGAVVAWGASMIEPGVYERTSEGGFTLGRLDGAPDDAVAVLARMLESVGPVKITANLLGARWSKLAINCAVSTLGTIGGDRIGPLMRHRFVRRLALEIMTETVQVARAERVRLEKVAGTVDLEWLALTDAERAARGSPTLSAKHVVLLGAGLRYRRLRSSMLAAIERGRPPAVDFLNGEVVEHGAAHGVATPVNRAAQLAVWQIARGERAAALPSLERLYEETR
jgi:2-dehydropantoate 2-reductase